MLGLIDRANKECRVFCVLDNKACESLYPLVVENANTTNDINENNYNSLREKHEYCLSTRIYSDCWAGYRYNDFK